MKKVLLYLPLTLLIASLGCIKEIQNPPEAPLLILPNNGEIFDTTSPIFIWNNDQNAHGYFIRIYTGSLLLINEFIEDTIWKMSGETFKQMKIGLYEWYVSARWLDIGIDSLIPSSKRSFSINHTDDSIYPEKIDLISPSDGSVYETEIPLFIWHSDSFATDYILNMSNGTTTFLVDTTNDTAYLMSSEQFAKAENGLYTWMVAPLPAKFNPLWSSPRSFSIDRFVPNFDLDTTYFPFGIGYEWSYEVCHYRNYGEDRSKSYDTITVRVVDSTIISDTIQFLLDKHFFYDLDFGTVKIWEERLTVFSNSPGTSTVSLTPKTNEASNLLKIRYSLDTLYMGYHFEMYPPEMHEYDNYDCYTCRLKGIGLISQDYWRSQWWGAGSEVMYSGNYYRLLYFIKDQDTVWRSEGTQ